MQEDIKSEEQPLEQALTESGEITDQSETDLDGVAGGNPLILVPGPESGDVPLGCGCGSSNGGGAGGDCICGSENGSGA